MKIVLTLATLVTICLPVAGQQQQLTPIQERTIRNIRKELVTLPFYSVFDNLAFRLDGDKVTLFGQVSRPSLKTDSERVVKQVENVVVVDNQIEVLPNSPNDDRIRLRTYRAIYSKPQLQRYAMQAVPPIHIIVKNGNVALEGVVANQGDKIVAGIAANGVSGVFGVTNNLISEQGETAPTDEKKKKKK